MNVLVVATHPDDETLGCGGTILRHTAAGDRVSWLIATSGKDVPRFAAAHPRRQKQIERVRRRLGIHSILALDFPTTRLTELPETRLIEAFSDAFKSTAPHTVYLPHDGDAHSDHRAVARAAASCLKWFRRPSVKRILSFETPSETDQPLLKSLPVFTPNVFVDISKHLEGKIAAMKLYESEIERFPFPRSEENIRAWAATRGAQSGFRAAEAFCLLRERI
ncbi:MAG: PIG-L family deacetylase [Elusimicrobia bacterium]|nr:PIG-L family deacetylase [Elusimicrobiota bacterium]